MIIFSDVRFAGKIILLRDLSYDLEVSGLPTSPMIMVCSNVRFDPIHIVPLTSQNSTGA